MPQMAPLNWLTLFIFFIIIFLMFNMMTYFVFLYTPLKNKFNTKTSQINWKW
uniref:ATP synthase complex subunit 8 n=1 Tax=Nicrophorus nepalensis TaxID=307049 RepID=A0A8A5RFP7_NICNE|nr:ATP synthase F0 subunit 8 [Nicrophorus nepalensis]QTG39886.1 ATP synthase F0 subunit 8 [Nicrophorus nepalensis]